MKVTADTNVLVRAVTSDDDVQSPLAAGTLRDAELVAVPIPVLCQLVWVLTRGYDLTRTQVAAAVRALTQAANVVTDSAAVDAGLAVLDAGGDFADGAIAHHGTALGADTFVTFDRQAARLVAGAGIPARLLGIPSRESASQRR
ncbi:MAG: type II toxin-antitoxin system VapC family toxin [Micrococcales bacterium]|nr:type II toxin-antitoxin system VapC family toxin [Micrococcales bacterium]